MDFSTDLLRVLWHEIGHLCVDIIETIEDKNYTIDDFWVSYHEAAISKEKWGGAVKMVPPIKFEILVDDEHKTSFALIGAISGCMFQTIFTNEFVKGKVKFEDCFGHQRDCVGYGDFCSFFEIGSQYRRKFGNRKDFTNFINIELFEMYRNMIVDNKNFLQLINNLTIKYRDLILEEYNNSENKKEFHYHFQDNALVKLIEEITEILVSTDFYKTIESLKNVIQKKMELDKATPDNHAPS